MISQLRTGSKSEFQTFVVDSIFDRANSADARDSHSRVSFLSEKVSQIFRETTPKFVKHDKRRLLWAYLKSLAVV